MVPINYSSRSHKRKLRLNIQSIKCHRLHSVKLIIISSNILDVGETTRDVGEMTVGETTCWRNDRNSEASH